MIRHARAEAPNEACGLLAGADGAVSAVHCLANARRSPAEYELTADGYLLAMDLDEAGRLLGSFHSHPCAAAYPSPSDVRLAYWPILYIIVSLAGEHPVVRAFRIRQRSGDGTDAEGGQPAVNAGAADVEDVELEVI